MGAEAGVCGCGFPFSREQGFGVVSEGRGGLRRLESVAVGSRFRGNEDWECDAKEKRVKRA